jgi:SAM-dependent methyltransferase
MTRPVVSDSKARFSVRVGDYVKYRPGYPAEVVGWLRGEIGLREDWVVADVGAGTGISAKVFLDAGCEVVAVEPNREMREAAVAWLGGSRRFRAVDGAAEGTGLAAGAVDMVVCAQAFHWFDLAGARREFRRVLRPGGWVVLMWNDRNRTGSPFAEGYDALLRRYGEDYEKVRHDQVPEREVREFLGVGGRVGEFPNRQEFDFEGLKGRLMSSSYAPREGHPDHAPMIAALWDLFERHKVAGRVTFEYRTRLFCGRLC